MTPRYVRTSGRKIASWEQEAANHEPACWSGAMNTVEQNAGYHDGELGGRENEEIPDWGMKAGDVAAMWLKDGTKNCECWSGHPESINYDKGW